MLHRMTKTLLFALCISLLAGAGIVSARKPLIRSPRDVPTTGCYIVVLEDTTTLEEFEQTLSLVKEVSIDRKVYVAVKNVQKAFTVKLSARVLEEVRRLDQVKYIEEENLVEGAAALPWHLDRLDQAHLPLDNLYTSPGDGEGVDIYILDTGIDFDHEEFEQRAKYAGYDPVDQYTYSQGIERRSGQDCHGHGTHVASLAGGKTYGVAKKASLYSVRVLRCENSAPWSIILDGLDFVSSIVPKRGRNAIVSISLSGSFHRSVNDAIEVLHQQGIPVVVAAGNDNGDACTRSPASSVHAITIGATNRNDRLYELSNYGRCVDIFAPGESLMGADYTCPSCANSMTGTSQAVPLVSGVAAVYLSQSPLLTPDQLKQKMIDQSLKDLINFEEGDRSATPNRLLSIGCGSRFYASDDPQQLQSPHFPMNYPNNLKCTWTIIGQRGDKVKVNFSYLKLEENYDTLTICDGSKCGPSNRVVAKLTGKYEHVDCGYVSTGRSLTLVMETDGSTTSPGFNATYLSYDETAAKEQGVTFEEKDCRLNTAVSGIQLDMQSAALDVGNRFSIKRDWKEIFAGRLRGLNIAILDEITGKTRYTGTFDTHLSAQKATDFAATVKSIRSGRIVLIAVSNDASQSLNDGAKRAIRTLGSEKINQLGNGDSWALVGIKGTAPGTAIERLNDDSSVQLSIQYKLQQARKHGLQIVAKSAGTSFGNSAEISIEGEIIPFQYSRGLNVIVVNEKNGRVLHKEAYDTHTDAVANTVPADSFASFINSLPDGRVVAIAMKGEAVDGLTESAIQACKRIGSTLIEQVQHGGSWAIIGTKGGPSIYSAAEAGSNGGAVQSAYWLPLHSTTTLNTCNISVRSSGWQKGLSTDIIINDIQLARRFRGISVAVVKEATCVLENVETFDTFGSTQRANDLASLIHKIPVGRIVIAAIWDEGSDLLTEHAKLALESIGSALIRNVGHREAWAIIGRKGAAPGSVPEVLHASSAALRAVQELKAKNGFKVTAQSAGYKFGNYWAISVDGVVMQIPGYARGMNVIIVDESNGTVIHRESFDTYSSSTRSGALANLINSLPIGRIVAVAIKDEGTDHLTEPAIEACESIGSSLIRQIGIRGSWAIIGRKGAPKGTVAEVGSNTAAVEANAWFPVDKSTYSACNIAVVSAGFDKGLRTEIDINGQKALNGQIFRGITVAVVDQSTCVMEKAKAFDTWGSSSQSNQLATLIRETLSGKIVVATIWDEGTERLTENAKLALESIGSVRIRAIRHREAWAIIGRKGASPGSVPEAHHPNAVALQSWVKVPTETCEETIYPLNCLTSTLAAENSPILA